MEDFSALPRLYRDAAVNELWKGPRNVLLPQIHRDLLNASPWYGPDRFVASILAGAPSGLIEDLQREIVDIFAHPNLFEMSPTALSTCERWDSFCHRFFHAYQDVAMDLVERHG